MNNAPSNWFRLIGRREAFQIVKFAKELSGTLDVVIGENDRHMTKARVEDVIFLNSSDPEDYDRDSDDE